MRNFHRFPLSGTWFGDSSFQRRVFLGWILQRRFFRGLFFRRILQWEFLRRVFFRWIFQRRLLLRGKFLLGWGVVIRRTSD